MGKALKVTVKNRKGETKPYESERVNNNNLFYGFAKSNEKTTAGKILNRVMKAGRFAEKGMEFISGSSARMSPNRGLNQAISLGMKHSLIRRKK
jgi:hypothetical protein